MNQLLYKKLEIFRENRNKLICRIEKVNDQEWRFSLNDEIELVIKSFWDNLVISLKSEDKFVSLTAKSDQKDLDQVINKLISLQDKFGGKYPNEILLVFQEIKN